MCFLRRGVVSTSPHPQAGGPPLIGCPRLLIQFIHSYPPYRRPFLHPQPEDAPCRGDRDTHPWDEFHNTSFIWISSTILTYFRHTYSLFVNLQPENLYFPCFAERTNIWMQNVEVLHTDSFPFKQVKCISYTMTLTLARKLKVATLLGSNLVRVTCCPDLILAVYRRIPI